MIAGLSVAGLMLPEAVAYAAIAGLPPGRALVAAVAGGLAYALIGQSRFAIIAPTSSSAAILAAALATLPGTASDKAMLATAMVAIVAALFGVIALFRLGGLAGFIARPVLRGFAFGLAITIILRQLPSLTGLHLAAPNIFLLVGRLASQTQAMSLYSILIGGAALAAILAIRRAGKLPGALIVLGCGVGLASLVDLPAHGVALVGPIAIVLDKPSLPNFGFQTWSHLVQLALPLTLILFAESWGTMRALALRHGDTLSANRELGALGGANLVAALFQGMPVGAGFSAGSASEAAGASSQLSAAVASFALAALVVFAGSAVARIPEPVLAAVVIAALTHALAIGPFSRLFRIDRDQWIALAAVAGVIGFGVLNGMLIAVALSVGVLLHRLSRPTISELGRIGTSHDFVDRARHDDAGLVDGIAIYRPNAPLFFANADMALAAVGKLAVRHPAGTQVILSLEESNDFDSSAVEVLAEFEKLIQNRGMVLRLARTHDRVRELLTAAGLTELASDAGFSVADSVEAAQRKGL
ncbi:SulP family inorganic anion transporter [Sphingomonas sp.]|uniref:SulP family inorganic anion transporter n=1 Tax=Sphingomonas sp. TaxID=28214 RepID=UPI0025FEBD6E|nr:SulP family inorganic anion transporter [Sphingomonas sp.]